MIVPSIIESLYSNIATCNLSHETQYIVEELSMLKKCHPIELKTVKVLTASFDTLMCVRNHLLVQ